MNPSLSLHSPHIMFELFQSAEVLTITQHNEGVEGVELVENKTGLHLF